LIVFGCFMRCVSSPTNCGAQFAGDVKNSQIISRHQDPPQFILQDRYLASLIFVYFKVEANLKYSVSMY